MTPTGGRPGPWRIAARVIAGCLVLLLILTGGALAWVLGDLPPDAFAADPGRQTGVILEAADGSLIGRRGELRAEPVTRSEFPDHLVNAVLAIEDRRFYEHNGFDASGIARAIWRNFQAGEVVEGGSTITQQLAKVRYLESDRTLRRKLQEAAIALWLELRLSKDEILTRYLNSIYMGAGTYGIGAASVVYFDKPPQALTLSEAAVLAGLIRAPSNLNPIADPEAARDRAALVLQSMVDAGMLSREEALRAALSPAAASGAATRANGGWFADWVHGQAEELAAPFLGSVRVRTTLMPQLQVLAEDVVAGFAAEAAGKKAGEVALIAMTHDGAVVAMVGGRDYASSQFNRAAQALRQPGSAFKLFVYLAALRQGWELSDRILDAPIEISGWKPQNYGGRYYGQVPLQDAFARSLNASTVRLAQDVGIGQVVQAARDLGIDAELESNASLALGTSGVSLLDLTGAFASVAAGRMPVQPRGIVGLLPTGKNASLVTPPRPETRALDHRDELVQLLEGVVRNGTGRRAALDGFAAGKTGTSQNSRDAWFIGFTDRLVAGVWVGNDDDSPMNGVTGGDLPARIWQAFMSEATGLAPTDLGPADPQPAADVGTVTAATPPQEAVASEALPLAPPPPQAAPTPRAAPEQTATQPSSPARRQQPAVAQRGQSSGTNPAAGEQTRNRIVQDPASRSGKGPGKAKGKKSEKGKSKGRGGEKGKKK